MQYLCYSSRGIIKVDTGILKITFLTNWYYFSNYCLFFLISKMSPLTTKTTDFPVQKNKISMRKYVCRCLGMTLHLIFYKVKLFSHSRWPKKGTFIPTFAYWKHEHHKKMSPQQDKWQSKNTLKQTLISTPFRKYWNFTFFLKPLHKEDQSYYSSLTIYST